MAVTEYTDDIPILGQDPTTFSTNNQNYVNYVAVLAPEINSTAAAMTTSETNASVSETNAAASEVNAAASASAAQSVANYQGAWSTLTGAYNLGISASHNSKTWRLDVNLADITLSEPGVSGDWTDITSVTPSGNNTFTGTNDFQAGVTDKSITVTSTANSTVIDCSLGNSFLHVLTENTTLSFSNIPASGQLYVAHITIVQDAGASGYAVTLPTAKWPGGTLPTFTATANAQDELVWYTRDGGTTWGAFNSGTDMVTV